MSLYFQKKILQCLTNQLQNCCQRRICVRIFTLPFQNSSSACFDTIMLLLYFGILSNTKRKKSLSLVNQLFLPVGELIAKLCPSIVVSLGSKGQELIRYFFGFISFYASQNDLTIHIWMKLVYMCTSILNQIKLMFTWKVLHMDSVGNSGKIELEKQVILKLDH